MAGRRSSLGRSPRIDEVDAGALEVRPVTGSQYGTTRSADGRDERIEPGDWPTGSLTSTRDDGVVLCGCYINRQDLIGKSPEDVGGGINENLLPPAVRKAGQAIPDLGQRDRRREQLTPVRLRVQEATWAAGSGRISSRTALGSRR